MTQDIQGSTSLCIERTFTVSQEKVFRAWTDPVQLQKWFAPTEGVHTTAKVDLQEGGEYSITMGSFTARGHYREIKPYDRLVFTWRLDHEDHFAETLITLTLRPQSGGTFLSLLHERLANHEEVKGHQEGWSLNLSRLEKYLVVREKEQTK